MWGLIREAARQDIIDLNYSYSSEKLGTLKNLSAEELPRRGLLIRIASFSLHFLWALLHPERGLRTFPERPVVFFANSLNQRESIQPVARHVRGSVLMGTYLRPGAKLDCDRVFSLALSYLLSLPFLPLVIKGLWKADGYRRESFFFYFDEYWLSYGHYLSTRIWLRRRGVRSVVISNDHNMLSRTLAIAARDEGIPTIYLQHGAGSTRNPPLAFAYALLDGRDSLGKFETAGASRTRIFLVGKPRSDANHGEVNQRDRARSIGVCTNFIDPIARVEGLCHRLREDFPTMDFTIRPHPRDDRRIWNDLAGRYSMALSDAKVESPFEFLRAMDVIVAGDSSIHVEAALMNTYPLFFDYPLTRSDTHDFLASGLVDYASEFEEISSRIRELSQHKPDVRFKAKPFVATVETPHDGRSGELAAELVEEIASGREVLQGGRQGWKRIAGVLLEAYELAETSPHDGD